MSWCGMVRYGAVWCGGRPPSPQVIHYVDAPESLVEGGGEEERKKREFKKEKKNGKDESQSTEKEGE